jgi:hypothetical protein
MTKRRRILYLIAVGLVIVVVISGVLAYRAISSTVSVVGILARGEEGRIRVPEGFEVGIFAEGLDRPRFMNFGTDGKLYVAERGAGAAGLRR